MCGADEDKADQGYYAILDRDGEVGRVNMRIPFNSASASRLMSLSDFILFSRDPCDARAGGLTDSAEQTGTGT
jgi:hypothetical protein